MESIAVIDDHVLHAVNTIKDKSHFNALRMHCLRMNGKYEGVGAQVITLIDNAITSFSGARHLVFDARYRMNDVRFNDVVEYQYRMYVLAMAMERVILTRITPEDVYVAIVVGGNNVDRNGRIYEMEPVLHMIIDPNVSDALIIEILTDLYGYMETMGYVVEQSI